MVQHQWQQSPIQLVLHQWLKDVKRKQKVAEVKYEFEKEK
jgi:hypothetical protein